MKQSGAILAFVHTFFAVSGALAQVPVLTGSPKTADAPDPPELGPSSPSSPSSPTSPSSPSPPAAPAPPQPAPAAPVPPAATPPVAPVAPPPAPAGQAVVHLAVNYRDAWLETRSYVDDGEFIRTCRAPCDIKLDVVGLEARVVAPGMTTSNAFRFDAGTGRAGVRVDGGSATARTVGIITLAAGIPVALAGMALLALGNQEGKSGTKAAGIAGLALGGVSIGVSLPLLLLGTTRVKNASGSRIAGLLTLPAEH